MSYWSFLREVGHNILSGIGEDPAREGLESTPERWASMMLEMTTGLREEPPEIALFSCKGHDQLITIMNLDYYSLCEHHLVPFFGRVHIGYLPLTKIVGLSKFGRVVDWISHKPQTQEYMTGEIADYLVEKIDPRGLIVVVEGFHLCMAMRGVKKSQHKTITSAIRREIDKKEFLDILKGL
jgi:GTP cyclohydrolase I